MLLPFFTYICKHIAFPLCPFDQSNYSGATQRFFFCDDLSHLLWTFFFVSLSSCNPKNHSNGDIKPPGWVDQTFSTESRGSHQGGMFRQYGKLLMGKLKKGWSYCKIFLSKGLVLFSSCLTPVFNTTVQRTVTVLEAPGRAHRATPHLGSRSRGPRAHGRSQGRKGGWGGWLGRKMGERSAVFMELRLFWNSLRLF